MDDDVIMFFGSDGQIFQFSEDWIGVVDPRRILAEPPEADEPIAVK